MVKKKVASADKKICLAGFPEETVCMFEQAGYNVKHIPLEEHYEQERLHSSQEFYIPAGVKKEYGKFKDCLKEFLFTQNGINDYPNVVLGDYSALLVPFAYEAAKCISSGTVGGIYDCTNDGQCTILPYSNIDGKGQVADLGLIKDGNIMRLLGKAIAQANATFASQKKAAPVEIPETQPIGMAKQLAQASAAQGQAKPLSRKQIADIADGMLQGAYLPNNAEQVLRTAIGKLPIVLTADKSVIKNGEIDLPYVLLFNKGITARQKGTILEGLDRVFAR